MLVRNTSSTIRASFTIGDQKYTLDPGEVVDIENYLYPEIIHVDRTFPHIEAIWEEDQAIDIEYSGPVPGSTVRAALDWLKVNKADVTAVYDKTEIDALIADFASIGDHYTKGETDALVTPKADSDDVYTKSVVDGLLSAKSNKIDHYYKPEVNTFLAAKANVVDIYTKGQIDAKDDLKADKTTIYTQAQIDGFLATKAGFADVYIRSQADALLADKADTGHDHHIDYYQKTEVDTALASKADAGHFHDSQYYTEAEMDTFLAGKSDATHDHDTAYYLKGEVDTSLAGKSDTSHNHNTAYYLQGQVDTALGNKANTIHDHNTDYYFKADIDIALGTKANTDHNHDDTYYTETELNGFLSAKSNIGHDHDAEYYTQTQVDNLVVTNGKEDEGVAATLDAQHLSDFDHSLIHSPNTDPYLSTPITLIRYVDKNRADTYVADGSPTKPFTTVQAAIDSITDASETNYYVVFVLPGVYEEDLSLKPWVEIAGISKEMTIVRTSAPHGAHTCTFTAGGEISFKNVSLGGVDHNVVFTHAPGDTGSCRVHFDNVRAGDIVCNFLGAGVDSIHLRNDSHLVGKLTSHSGSVTAYNSLFEDGLEIDDQGVEIVDGEGYAAKSVIKDCQGGSLLCQGNTYTEFFNNHSWSSLANDGAVVVFDTQSAPDDPADLVNVAGSGTFIRGDKAYAIYYDNTTTGLTAETVQEAMDEIHNSTTHVESGQTPARPSSPNKGRMFLDETLNKPIWWNGSSWITADGTTV